MKIRNGFVSNSSSSSFVVNANSSMEAYYKILRAYNSDIRESWGEPHEHEDEMFVKTHDIEFNGGIRIPYTCNYDTYIFPSIDGECIVETCNNHEWGDIVAYYTDEEASYRHYDDNIIKFVDVTTGVVKTAKQFTHSDEQYGSPDEIDECVKSGTLIVELDNVDNVDIALEYVVGQIECGYKEGYSPRWYIKEN